ncbi:hypothetical protein [Marinimicrobium agarilyticum]|uniref:hypothetical protein n=1 Tax=Marinimicrobium agarilyticum TaxID=306546 RepID=UPI0006852A20|nr:hypothetical protein [Marinimicrobium agarilyticum]
MNETPERHLRILLQSVAKRFALLLGMASQLPAIASTESPENSTALEDSWLEVVRQTPYWESQGVAQNIATIRTWVLFSTGYCSEPDRHILFDRRGQFLAYIDNADSSKETVERLNQTRARLVAESRVKLWSPGSTTSRGYPFALACHQPFVDMNEAIDRLTGTSEEYRLWGTWDGMTVGAKDQPVSLIKLFEVVYEHRKAQGRFSFPDGTMATFLGKTIIESGGQKDALSRQAAQGIMQLRPKVLNDCQVPEPYRLHRMVQVDCALRLVEQNHRNLKEPFDAVFGHLPLKKREALYDLLLTQAYQIGVGRAIDLLTDSELGKAARYFAQHQALFSPEDILVGMIYHNVGRTDIGLRTLYYVTDTRLAQKELCASSSMKTHRWCQTGNSAGKY